jgi:hypothetical protein
MNNYLFAGSRKAPLDGCHITGELARTGDKLRGGRTPAE